VAGHGDPEQPLGVLVVAGLVLGTGLALAQSYIGPYQVYPPQASDSHKVMRWNPTLIRYEFSDTVAPLTVEGDLTVNS